jgi:23S rRNA (adenine2030-N6)-methyltransferase
MFAKDPAAKVLELDGWTMLKAVLPPKERRGVVLIDPPFEQPGEFRRLLDGLSAAHARFATGMVILWFPIKDVRAVRKFMRDAAALKLPKLLAVEFFVAAPRLEGELTGTGLLVLNPPFTLEEKLARLLPFLARTLARGSGAEGRIAWLTGERITSS